MTDDCCNRNNWHINIWKSSETGNVAGNQWKINWIICRKRKRNLRLRYSIFLEWLIVIIIVRHQLDLNRPVSASSHKLFKGLPSLLCEFGLQFSMIFDTLLLFIPVTCRNNFDLYLRSSSLNCSTFSSSKISSFIFMARGMDMCLFWVLCVVRKRSLFRAGHLSRGVLPTVVCLSVIVNPR